MDNFFSRYVIIFAGCLAFALCAPAASAQEKEETSPVEEEVSSPDCTGVISKAEKLFFNADFDTALDLLTGCMETNTYSRPEKVEIYLLLAQMHHANLDEEQAATTLEKLYALSPKYELGSNFPPPFIAFANHIKEVQSAIEVVDTQLLPAPPVPKEKKQKNRRILLFSGGGVAAITAIALIAGGSKSSGGFAPPPDVPSQR